MGKISDHQWLQFDLGPATQVTGMVTRGQGDRKRYVTSYTMAYSNDSVTWYEYKDSNHLEAKVRQFNCADNEPERGLKLCYLVRVIRPVCRR